MNMTTRVMQATMASLVHDDVPFEDESLLVSVMNQYEGIKQFTQI